MNSRIPKSFAPFIFVLQFALCAACFAAAPAQHVVLIVWDGMRPDFVSAQYTPQLYDLAQRGTFFKNHHSIYVSSTEVNGTALATGCYPNRSGIVANSEYRPEIGWLAPNATEGIEMIRRGDMATGGKYIRVPTICEIVQEAGFPTAVAGTKPVALLHDRAQRKGTGAAKDSIVLYAGKIMPSSLEEATVAVNDRKKFPTNTIPNTGRDEWTVKAPDGQSREVSQEALLLLDTAQTPDGQPAMHGYTVVITMEKIEFTSMNPTVRAILDSVRFDARETKAKP